MGIAPEQIDRMDLWTYAVCVDAWEAANSGGDRRESEEELPDWTAEEYREFMTFEPPPAVLAQLEELAKGKAASGN